MEDAYVHEVEQVALTLNVDVEFGLTGTQARLAREKFGDNSLPEEPPTSIWSLVLAQFQDQLSLILLASASVSFALAFFEGDVTFTSLVDPLVILTILILNAIIGVQQERSAELAIAALGEYTAGECQVLRNGKLSKIKPSELVPGDIVDLSVGDSVPADCRIAQIISKNFHVDQAILTGESESVSKHTHPIKDPRAVKQDQLNMVFSGTVITVGHARAVVVLTGSNTAIGDIHKSIVSQISEPTPLKQKLDDFGDVLAKVIMVICILVWVINFKNFSDPVHGGLLGGAVYYFKIAVALAVAAIPEGLAVVITTCLALGTRKMAARNAIVRNLPSVETLGSTTIICSDKTGTLTTNQMCVSDVVYFSSDQSTSHLKVSGTSYDPLGSVTSTDGSFSPGISSSVIDSSRSIYTLAQVCSLCNDSEITFDAATKTYGYVGEPTEAALKVLVEKLGRKSVSAVDVSPVTTNFQKKYPRLTTFEFSRDRKSMSVLVKQDDGVDASLLVKGAAESIISRSSSYMHDVSGGASVEPLTPNLSKNLLSKVAELGEQGLRVIAVAIKDEKALSSAIEAANSNEDYEAIERDLTFIGFVGMRDPPRPGVRESVETCYKAGIRVVVITGDSKETAKAICSQIGVITPEELDQDGIVYTGRELESLSDDELARAIKTAKLFARVEPSHKSLLVDYYQNANEVVAMTGDGVNDAPALKKADIGIAMGSGTDVAKLAADMVLADDNFSTIEAAVEEGRAIYNNTRQFIRYLISSNIGEVVSIFLTVLLGLPEALLPVQLLWVNLVTDGLPATALGFNPADNEIMSRPPRPRDEPIVGRWLFFRYMVVGTYVGVATVFGYAWYFLFYSQGPQISFQQLSHFHSCSSQFPEIGCEMFLDQHAQHASTISLSILVIIEMFNAMNALSESDSLLSFPIWKNPYLVGGITLSIVLHLMILHIPFLSDLFSTIALSWPEWKAILLISFPVIIVDEVFKLVERTLWLNKVTVISADRNYEKNK